MIIINKPDEFLDVQCYRCNTIMKIHPMTNMNSDYFSECKLHKKECSHESDYGFWIKTDISYARFQNYQPNTDNFAKCTKCGAFYRG